MRIPARTWQAAWPLAWLILIAAAPPALGAAADVPAARRVVCLAPAFTEICFALGRGEQVVGVTDFCDFPPEATRRTRVGGFLNPRRETIVSLRPDLVLAVPEEAELVDDLRRMSIRSEILPLYRLADIDRAIRSVAAMLGDPAAGNRLADSIAGELAALRSAAGDGPSPRVLLVVGRNWGDLANIYVAGPETFLGELLALAGGRNAYTGSIRYPSLSLEGISRLNPEVILELYPGQNLSTAQKAALQRDWDRLPGIAAVQAGRVVVLDDSFLAIPGPRVARSVRAIRRAILGRAE
jgi:iron complex transport system substrate-binding protein